MKANRELRYVDRKSSNSSWTEVKKKVYILTSSTRKADDIKDTLVAFWTIARPLSKLTEKRRHFSAFPSGVPISMLIFIGTKIFWNMYTLAFRLTLLMNNSTAHTIHTKARLLHQSAVARENRQGRWKQVTWHFILTYYYLMCPLWFTITLSLQTPIGQHAC